MKLPSPPADLAAVGIRAGEYRQITTSTVLWRLHRMRGEVLTPWNQLRHFGPVDARFEPHPPQPAGYPDRAVWYGAGTPRTAIAEVFQRTRTVPLTDAYHLTALRLVRSVRLLHITGDDGYGAWATRAGASMALATDRHDIASAWARRICGAFPDLGGIATARRWKAGSPSRCSFPPLTPCLPRLWPVVRCRIPRWPRASPGSVMRSATA